jgi:hypothetical protein
MLFVKSDRFMDWVNTLRSAALITPYSINNQVAMPVYGPLTYALMRPIVWLLSAFPGIRGLASLIWVAVSTVSITSVVVHLQRIRMEVHSAQSRIPSAQLLTGVLVSFPLLFAFDRGNLEIITFALVSWYISRVVVRHATLASIASGDFLCSQAILAVAVSIKPYLILFALVGAVNPRFSIRCNLSRLALSWLQILLMVFVFSIASLAYFYHGDVLLGLAEFKFWQSQFRSAYIIGGVGDLFYCSPYVAIKTLLAGHHAPSWLMRTFYVSYPYAALLVSVDVLCRAFRFLRRQPDLVLSLVVIAFVLLVFPYASNDYKAIYLVLPFFIAPFAAAESPTATWLFEGQSCFLSMLTPRTVSVGLAFVLLSNRYGLIGDKRSASMVASIALLLYPLLLLSAFRRVDHCPTPSSTITAV